MQGLKRILDDLLKRLGHEQKVKEKLALLYWAEVAGSEIALRAVPVAIKQGLLFVTVENPVWAHQLLYLKPALVKKLNQRLGQTIVKDIRFQMGQVSNGGVAAGQEDGVGPVMVVGRELTVRSGEQSGDDPELAKAEKELLAGLEEGITDPEMREAFRRLLTLERARLKERRRQGYKPCPVCGTLIEPKEDVCPICARKPTWDRFFGQGRMEIKGDY